MFIRHTCIVEPLHDQVVREEVFSEGPAGERGPSFLRQRELGVHSKVH